MVEKGKISVNSENLMPIIKKWLYSDRDIFIRELVSNGVDAVSKHKKLASMGEYDQRENYFVRVTADKDAGTLTFEDNGIGMTKEDVEKYINQVAFSGAADFLQKYESTDSAAIIGHFGLGFYSAFMVAETVTIETKSYSAEPVKWVSDGSEEYEISDCDKAEDGTKITLKLNSDSLDFAENGLVRKTLEKYCAFMPVNIILTGENEDKPINDADPLWLKKPADCTEEEYKDFYHKLFNDFNDPLFWIHLNVDYPFNLKGIIYFPKLTENPESVQGQIKLFNNQVFVADNIKEVIPEFLMLLKGVIDCPDMPLNVSRSFLQNDRTVMQISNHITKKITDRLCQMYSNEKETYEKYWDDINVFIKYGCLRDQKFDEKLKDKIIYKTTDEKFVTIEGYLGESEDKTVYYASNIAAQSQYIEILKKSGKQAVILNGMLDIPFMQHVEMQQNGVKFSRVDASLAGEKISSHLFDSLCEFFKKTINDENVSVEAQEIETDSPAVLLTEEFGRRMDEAQKYYGMPSFGAGIKYTLVLNTKNELCKKVNTLSDGEGKDKAVKYIFDLARLAGGKLESDKLAQFISESAKNLEKTL